MADAMYVQDDDGENSDEVSGNIQVSELRNGSNQDDNLPPLLRLEKYATSDNMFNRQMVGRVALETLRAVADTPEDIRAAMEIINRAAKDSEVSVRAELMEQLPHIAMICHEERDKLHYVVQEYLLPLVIKFLGDSDNQVRKTTQAALLVLMEQGLVEMNAVEEQVCPVILMLTELDSLVEFHTGAVALMSKMAPLIGRSATERLFMRRFAALCSDPVFYVRKVCANNFGEFCSVVGTRPTEEFLLPHFVELCSDGIWGVRKACAEVFMSVSCTCTLQTRKNTLAPVFNNLLVDQSRWVRMSAFQALGPFISTFANLSSSGLAYNHQGELILLDQDNDSRFNVRERYDALFSPGRGGDNVTAVTSITEQTTSLVCDQSYQFSEVSQTTMHEESHSDEANAICYVCDMQTSSASSAENVHSVSVRNTEFGAEESELSRNTHIDFNNVDCVVSVHNYSRSSVEDSGSTDLIIGDSNSHICIKNGRGNLPDSFNTFQYWRVPIPDLNMVDAIEEDCDRTTTCSRITNYEISDSCASEGKLDVDAIVNPELDNLASRLEKGFLLDKTETLRKVQTPDLCMASVEVDTEKHDIGNSRTMTVHAQNTGRFHHKGDDFKVFNTKHHEEGHIESQSSVDHQMQSIVPSSHPTQDIVPQLLIDHFVSMTHPSQAQNTDNEITHYCAFSIPAVALTLGRANWNLIKKAYEALASDVQWKVRRTVAASIHELAVILGEELATKDLVPVFNGFIKDLDEVRIGALKHLADFLKLLRPAERNTFLHRLSEFHLIDNECNWRFREELAEQLLHSVELFSPEDTREHITPLAISLLMDKVAAVRQMALYLVTQLVHHVSAEINLVRSLLAELAEQFAHNKHWNRRQTFALLCSRLVSEQVLPDEHFASDVFPHLLDLSWDRVPNVRLAVARTLACDIVVQSYFSSSESPHNEVLIQCLRRLQKDNDRDVRYFASLYLKPASTPNVEFCTAGEQ